VERAKLLGMKEGLGKSGVSYSPIRALWGSLQEYSFYLLVNLLNNFNMSFFSIIMNSYGSGF
jgi:hypothetical protein